MAFSSTSTTNVANTSAHLSSAMPKLNFSSPDAQSFVTIVVGKGDAQQKFQTHKYVVTHFSPDFFGRAFNSAMKEGKTQEMTIDDVEASIFGIFNNWLYTQELVNEDGKSITLVQYAKLWSLAQRFLMPRLEAELLEKVKNTSPSEDSKSGSTLKDFQYYAYVDAPAEDGSALRNIAVDMTVCRITATNMNEMMEHFPKDMLMDFAKAMVTGKDKLTVQNTVQKPERVMSDYSRSMERYYATGGGRY